MNGVRPLLRKVKQACGNLTSPKMSSALVFSDEKFLNLFVLESVKPHIKQQKTELAKTTLIEYYSDRIRQRWLEPPRQLTDLRIDLEELSNGELVEKANSILEFEISPSGVKPGIDNNGNIEWTRNMASKREWLLMLNRHAWWIVLGKAYRHTHDERYAQTFVSQLVDWIDNNPPISRKNEKSATWRLMEVGLRLRISWIPAFALFFDSPNFSEEVKLKMLRSIYDHARFLMLFKTHENHLLRESNGLAYVSVYFSEFAEADQWKQEAFSRLQHELTKQVNEDGSHIEMSVGYQWLVIDEFEKTYELLRKHNLSLPGLDLGDWLKKMYRMLGHVIRPDLSFPQINDGFILWTHKRLAQAGQLLGCDDLTFVGSGGKAGQAPERKSIAFDDAGMYVMRSDWSENARYLLFDAGPYGGHHGHEDKLSIEIYAYGQSFIVDSGSYTYEKTDPYRKYFVSSHAHNTVLVDGMSQVRRWRPENLSPKCAKGNYATWKSDDAFDFVSATYNEGYGDFNLKKPKNATLINDVNHTRQVLFVKPHYWIVIDKLRASKTHDYQFLFHADPNIGLELGRDARVILTSVAHKSGICLTTVTDHDVVARVIKGSEQPIQGWYSEDHHKKVPSSTIVFEQKNVADVRLVTLLYPFKQEEDPSVIKAESLSVSEEAATALKIVGPHGVDYLMLSETDQSKTFGPYQTNSMLAAVRTHHTGGFINRFESSLI